MARIAPKATRGKGKKWLKGQSCTSNPESKKHRNKILQQFEKKTAKNLFTFSELKLNKDTLEKFDAIQQQKQKQSSYQNDVQCIKTSNEMDIENEECRQDKFDAQSIGQISAASVWSNCSNISFNRFLNAFDAKSKLHKTMLSILATLKDAIDQMNGKETETEYFSGLMLTLNVVDSEEKLTATMALIQMVLKRVSVEILKSKFLDTSDILMKVLYQKLSSSNVNSYLIKSIISSLHILLQNQEELVWRKQESQKIFNTFLLLVLSQKPRIRKAANFAVISIVCQSIKENPSSKIASKLLAEFCIQKLEEHLVSTIDEHLNILLHIFNILNQTMACFACVDDTKRVIEAILSHMNFGNVLIVTNALHVFYSLFLRKPQSNVLSPELNARLLNALYDYQPNVFDDQPLNAWCLAVKEGLICLHNLDAKLCHLHSLKFLRTAMKCFQNESSQVASNVCNAIKTVFIETIIVQDSQISDEFVLKHYAELEESLKYQYSHAWTHIIPMLGELFSNKQILNQTFTNMMQRLAIINDSNDSNINKTIEEFFAKAVKFFGAKTVLKNCPVQWKVYTTGNMSNDLEFKGEITNSWLLPILRDHTEGSELRIFFETFLPMANHLSAKIKSLNQKTKELIKNKMQVDEDTLNDSFNSQESCLLVVKELERCHHAFWSLLPSFCRRPTDVSETFPQVAKRFGEILYDPSLYAFSLAGLRNLLADQDEMTRKCVGRFAKNFLPILFNIYTNENENNQIGDDARFPILVLIELFLPLLFINSSVEQTDSSPCLFRTFYEKIKSSLRECSAMKRNFLLDILRTFLLSPQGFEESDIKEIYSTITKDLIEKPNTPAEQKKGFRMVEHIFSSSSRACLSFVQNHHNECLEFLFSLTDNSKSLKSASIRAFALRSLMKLIERFLLKTGDDIGDIIEIGINWNLFLERSLTIVLDNIILSSSKARKSAQNALIIMNDSYKLLASNKQTKSHGFDLVWILISKLKKTPLKVPERIGCLSSLVFLYQNGYHHPLVPKQMECEIADTVFNQMTQQTNNQTPLNRQILSICFEFLRQFFRHTSPEMLNSYLKVITCTITNLPVEHRTKYRMRIRVFLTKLIRRFGFNFINSMIPEDYRKVLKNIRKFEERKAKKSDDNDDDSKEESDADMQSDKKSRRSKRKSKFFDSDDDDDEEDLDDELIDNPQCLEPMFSQQKSRHRLKK